MGTPLLSKEQILAQPDEEYMNEAQLAFFRQMLADEREELRERIDRDFQGLRDYEMPTDPADVGSAEEQRQSQLNMLEREKRLLDKIDHALDRIARGEYGWCEESGDPIGLRRLMLRPTATLSIEAKERQEQLERHVREA
jgi:DnaK suppressor protein